MNKHTTTTTTKNHPPEQDPGSLLGRFSIALTDIKLAHSVFAMPFALLGAFLVAPVQGAPPARIDWYAFLPMLVLIVVCMVFARTWAMLVNRFVDRRIDAENPRTSGRAFASGSLTVRDAILMLSGSAVFFILSCALFGVLFSNWLPTILATPVLLWIAFYSLTKRFTWLCHLFLGGALAASPIAAAIAVNPQLIAQTPGLFWIAGMVVLWVAGFDVIYALQDLEYDREVGLNSIPAQFGWRRAIWICRTLHALALGSLAIAWTTHPDLGWLFGAGVLLVAALLATEHAVLFRRGRAGIPMAFFTLNGVVSIVLGFTGCVDLLERTM